MRGILVVNGNPCRRDRVADALMDGQNGKRADRAVKIAMPCGQKSKKKKKKKSQRRR
jgi:hypothetical protein